MAQAKSPLPCYADSLSIYMGNRYTGNRKTADLMARGWLVRSHQNSILKAELNPGSGLT